MPDDEADGSVLVGAGPAVRREIDTRQRVAAGTGAVKRPVPVQEVVFRQQARVNVAVAEVQCRAELLMDVGDLDAGALAESAAEDE